MLWLEPVMTPDLFLLMCRGHAHVTQVSMQLHLYRPHLEPKKSMMSMLMHTRHHAPEISHALILSELLLMI